VSVLNAHQVAQYLVNNSCPSSRVVAWAAVSLGESGWDTRAESPVGARGIFQFMPGSWPLQCGSYDNAWDPDVSCFAAMILSNQGQNFAPWDSAYTDIYISGRLSFLSWPEVGSADYRLMVNVAADLGPGYHAQIVPNTQPGITPTLPGALSWYAATTNNVLPRLRRSTHGYAVSANRTY
jgi:hypothetical protein